MRIDSHHHLWHFVQRDYPWISEVMPVLRRDYLPADLEPALRAAGIDGTIVVQAQQTIAETDWMLGLARDHGFIRGVVGWVPLADPGVDAHLERLASDPHLKAVRHIVHDEPD